MYSSVADMTERWGPDELVAATTLPGQDAVAVNEDRVNQVLTEASDIIDSYLRLRYQVPLANPPASITRAAAQLARFDLAFGPSSSPTEEMRLARKETIEWLNGIANGRVTLDGVLPQGDASFAQCSDRPSMFSGAAGCPAGRFYP